MAPAASTPENDVVIGRRWKLGKKLAAGSFGEVVEAIDMLSGAEVAIKIQIGNELLLATEREVYSAIWSHSKNFIGIPRVYGLNESQGEDYIVMDRLGTSIWEHQIKCGGRFSLKTTLMIGIQALSRLETIHDADFVHRDLKPDNMVMGRNDDQTLYFIDFGLSKRYRDGGTKEHYNYSKECSGLTGSLLFAPLNSHNSVRQTRRDDLESLGYVLVYMFQGSLPWADVNFKLHRLKEAKVCLMKQTAGLEVLCCGIPSLVAYFRTVRDMKYEDIPDYEGLKNLFKEHMKQKKIIDDGAFDWHDLSGVDNTAVIDI